MATTYASLRRQLAQRMGFWGGDISSGGSGVLTTGPGGQAPAGNQIFDSNRSEPDGAWNGAWVVVNPGTPNAQWRQIASDGGYSLNGGVMSLSTPFAASLTAGVTTYEIYAVARPEQWLTAVNWAVTNAYPERHARVAFEIAEDNSTRVYDYKALALGATIPNPTTAPAVTATANPFTNPSTLVAGNYTIGYAWTNPNGMTKVSTGTTTVAVTTGQVLLVDLSAIAVPDSATGVVFFMSLEPGDGTLGSVSLSSMALDPLAYTGAVLGKVVNKQVAKHYIVAPTTDTALAAPVYNTTSVDLQNLTGVQRRSNPGGTPERWVDMGPNDWVPLGQTTIEIRHIPNANRSLRFIGTAVLPSLATETDTTTEPVEMILAGAEHYLWYLLTKTSTLQGANWDKLSQVAEAQYNMLKRQYQQEQPRSTVHRPMINVGIW